MKRNLREMGREQLDLLIIGGGINGSAIARDAALRGLRVALVEQHDFGAGTTARSTRLIHGGLRYLETFDFGLVREGLREREILLSTAPHLVHSLPFVTPVYAGDRVGMRKLKLGMVAYDALSYDKSLPKHRSLRPDELRQLEPRINQNDLRGGMLYYDGQVELPERLCLENLLQASMHEARIANYATVRELIWSGGRVRGAVVEDTCRNERITIHAEAVVNAAGPWIDGLNSRLLQHSVARMRLTKGIHILTPGFLKHAIVLLAQRDGRLFFAIPWKEHTLIGTTDTDFQGDPATARAQADEVEYLISETRRVFPQLPTDQVYLAMAGVRPLVRARSGDAGSTSRRHQIVDHAHEGYTGLFSVLGGKITNQRLVAQETVDRISRYLKRSTRSATQHTPYPGAPSKSLAQFTDELVNTHTGMCNLRAETLRHLATTYGRRAERILSMVSAAPELARPLVDGDSPIEAEVHYAINEEMVRSSEDFLLRRTGLTLRPGLAQELAAPVNRALQRSLGWSADEAERDAERYTECLELLRVP